MAVSSASVKGTLPPPRSRGNPMKVKLFVPRSFGARLWLDLDEAGVRVRAAISRASFTRSLIAACVSLWPIKVSRSTWREPLERKMAAQLRDVVSQAWADFQRIHLDPDLNTNAKAPQARRGCRPGNRPFGTTDERREGADERAASSLPTTMPRRRSMPRFAGMSPASSVANACSSTDL